MTNPDHGPGTERADLDPPSRPRASVAGVVVLLLAVALLGGLAYYFGRAPRRQQQAQAEADTRDLAVPTVTVVTPTPSKAPTELLLPAEVKPWAEAVLYARASGFLRRLRVDLGARVKAGEVLAELDTPELELELSGARHELAQADHSAELARVVADREAHLLRQGLQSGQVNDEAQSNLAVARAKVAAARAKVERLDKLRAFSRITAPFAGTVSARGVNVGDLVTAGGTRELFRLVQSDPLRVYVRVPQPLALLIVPGQAAEILVPERPGRTFTARVVRTAGEITTESRTLLTELTLDNSGGDLMAGAFVQVRFPSAKGKARVTLPGNALLLRAEGPQVGRVRGDGTVALVSVKLGRDWGAVVEILSGVTATDRIILNPSDSLTSGTRVRVVAASRGGMKPR